MNVSLDLVLSLLEKSCESEFVKLLLEVMPKMNNGQNSCTGWVSACIKDQLK